MSKGSISKKETPTPEKGIRKKEEEEEFCWKENIPKWVARLDLNVIYV
jgi:hypothetical protein